MRLRSAQEQEGVFHGMLSYVLQDSNGQIENTHSVSAGLDYPGVGPEHSFLKTLGRAEYVSATDDEAVDAFLVLSKLEGILPALESAHAVAFAMKLARKMKPDESIVVTLVGTRRQRRGHHRGLFEGENMSAIKRVFENLQARGEGALIGYVTAGDPAPEQTPVIAEALITGGVDILELGLPFSDPIADGPTIQAASVRALRAGTTPKNGS